MRRLATALAVLLAILLATASLPPGRPATAADVIVVQPGQSIQAAIDAAAPGSIIRVQPGTYAENLQITKDGITLLGAGPGATILVPPAQPRPAGCTELFEATSGICIIGTLDPETGRVPDPVRGVSVQGFDVRGFPGAGVLVLGGASTRLQDNAASDNDDYGLAAFFSTGTVITGNSATRNVEAGIYVGDSPNANAVVSGNHSFDNDGFGLFFRDASQGAVRGNNVHGNCWGVFFLDTGTDVGRWSASGNQVTANNRACVLGPGLPFSGAGMVVAGHRDVAITGNTVLDHRPSGPTIAQGGIVVASSPAGGGPPQNVVVTGNTALRNNPDLLWDGTGTGILFTGNTCSTSVPPDLCA